MSSIEFIGNQVIEIVDHYLTELMYEYHRVVKFDIYGNIINKKWRTESIPYFIKNVLYRELNIDSDAKDYYLYRLQGYVSKKVSESIAFRDKSSKTVNRLSGFEYEEFCANLLREAKWTVVVTSPTGDKGIDLLANYEGVDIAIQCKRSTNAVSSVAVQNAIGGAKYYGIRNIALITNSTYSKAAVDHAQATNVHLLHHTDIPRLMSLLGINKEKETKGAIAKQCNTFNLVDKPSYEELSEKVALDVSINSIYYSKRHFSIVFLFYSFCKEIFEHYGWKIEHNSKNIGHYNYSYSLLSKQNCNLVIMSLMGDFLHRSPYRSFIDLHDIQGAQDILKFDSVTDKTPMIVLTDTWICEANPDLYVKHYHGLRVHDDVFPNWKVMNFCEIPNIHILDRLKTK